MSWDGEFAEASTAAAAAFVRTVVVVDDYFNYKRVVEPGLAAMVPAAIKSPGRPPIAPLPPADPARAEPAEPAVPDKARAPEEPPTHQLDHEALVAAFAERGIACSLLDSRAERDTDELRRQTDVFARRTDILILDWARQSDSGDFAVSVLKGLAASSRRLLVVIYTGSSATERSEVLGGLTRAGGDVNDANCRATFHGGVLTVVVIQKREALGDSFYAKSKVPEEELPATVLRLFGEINGGLLANAAMHGLGAIRDRTHAVLDAFGQDVDGAYVMHRALSLPRSGAEEQVEALLGDSVLDQLRERAIRGHVSDASVAVWFDHQEGMSDALLELGLPVQALVKGCESLTKRENKEFTRAVDQLLRKLHPRTNDADACKARFADLVYCGHPGELPSLVAGVVVRRGGEYLVCVMPSCDAERVPEDGLWFPFVPASANSTATSGRRSVRAGGVELSIDPVVRSLRSFRFKSSRPGTPVRPTSRNNRLVYEAEGGDQLFEFVARLRPMIALDLVSRVSQSLGRVGMMESEFIRLLGK